MNQSALTMDSPPDQIQSPKQVAIVEAATQLFLSQGFGAVSVDAIAAEAQVSKRTVYSHFENKEALFAGVMYSFCERSGGSAGCPMFNEDLVRHMPMKEILQKTGEHVLSIIVEPTAVKLFRVVMGEAGRFPELGRKFYDFGPGSMKEMMGGYFEQKKQSGELDIDNPQQAAAYFFSMIMEPLKMELLCGVRESVSSEEVKQTVADALEIFLKFYSPRAK
jgi:TetR/AcrR family transcriptional repressor of mexJK operon